MQQLLFIDMHAPICIGIGELPACIMQQDAVVGVARAKPRWQVFW